MLYMSDTNKWLIGVSGLLLPVNAIQILVLEIWCCSYLQSSGHICLTNSLSDAHTKLNLRASNVLIEGHSYILIGYS